MKTFKSAVDRWFYLVLLSIPASMIPTLLYADLDADAGLLFLLAAILLSALLLPVWILLNTRYCVDGETLDVRSGPFRWRIPRASIVSIEPSRSLLSSPALSLNRLRVRYGQQQEILLSPADREGFIKAVLPEGK